jgi:glycosyltransferase involved in cell wall biosynthesis
MNDHAKRPVIVSVFRYPLHDHEAMTNVYPRVMGALAESMDVHHFCYRSKKKHWLENNPGFFLHTMLFKVNRGFEADKWLKTLLWYFFAFPLGLWARRHKVDLIYIEETLPFFPLLLKWISGRPVVMSAADIFWDVYLPQRKPFLFLRKLCLRIDLYSWKRMAGLITHTAAFKEFAVENGIPASAVSVVPEACEKTFFHSTEKREARLQNKIPEDRFILIHHGILHPNKALDRVLAYLKPLLNEHPELQFLIAGEGPARPALERQVKKLGLEQQVQFLGWLPGVDILNNLLNASDVSLVMREGRFSDHFQVTASLLHSLACGCTILAANMKGISELVRDGENGLLFDPFSAENFRTKLELLMEHPELRKQYSRQAEQTANEQLEPGKIARLWQEALLHFLNNQKGK